MNSRSITSLIERFGLFVLHRCLLPLKFHTPSCLSTLSLLDSFCCFAFVFLPYRKPMPLGLIWVSGTPLITFSMAKVRSFFDTYKFVFFHGKISFLWKKRSSKNNEGGTFFYKNSQYSIKVVTFLCLLFHLQTLVYLMQQSCRCQYIIIYT